MSKIDNFDIIADLIRPVEGDDTFFLVQIAQRAKDGPQNKNKGALAAYYISNADQLLRKKDEIIKLAELHNGRAYINVSPKSKTFHKQNVVQELVRQLATGDNSRGIKRTVLSEAGKLNGITPRWIIDLDNDENYVEIVNWLAMNDVQWRFVPTKSYGHIITMNKFNTQAFGEKFPQVDVHKNAMGTLLYMNL